MTTAITMRSDAEIKDDVLHELAWDPRVDETEIGVQVKRGVVTLTGTVSSYVKRIAAAEAGHRVKGVLDIANDVIVKIPGVGKKTDTEVAQAVRSALKWDVLVPDEDIRSTVSEGRVTLEGEVDTWSQREDAEWAIRRLAGVAAITNLITVKPSVMSANGVRAAIEGAIERRAEREVSRLGVTVGNGVVTLTGAVRSWGERHAVEQAAGFAPGIRRVDSRLTVDPYL
ncbi:MAG: BON domain-containing protein [Phycisphaerales bacterium]